MSVLLTLGDVRKSFRPRIAVARSPRASNQLLSASLFRRIFVKLAFCSRCAIAALIVVFGALSYVQAQTTSPTPDPFVVQVTSNPSGFYAFAGDMTANGRFVVFESNGNLDTQNPRNADGNREIFLVDYAQRRIFQLTNTRNVLKPPPSPTPTPTPTPVPTPPDLSLVKIEISNNRPAISFEPELNSGKRIYTIVFSSNAPDPGNFDGTDSDALVADGNQEIWIYRLPEIDDVFDLTSGDDILPVVDLTQGTFRQVTSTPPSRPLRTGVFLPDVLDDNREASISDDGNTIAFISNRNLVPAVGNTDANAELFLCRTSNGFATGSNTIVQGTNTQDLFITPKTFPRFQQNPSLSGNGSVVAFLSTADLAGNNNDDNGHGNEEIFVADFSGSAVGNFRQLTKTKTVSGVANATVNVLSPGRRISRDGAYVAYESRAVDPTANNTTNAAFLAMFVSKVSDSTAKIVGKRAPECDTCVGDVLHFPTFTNYDGTLAPHALVFASALNFKPDGTLVEKT